MQEERTLRKGENFIFFLALKFHLINPIFVAWHLLLLEDKSQPCDVFLLNCCACMGARGGL